MLLHASWRFARGLLVVCRPISLLDCWLLLALAVGLTYQSIVFTTSANGADVRLITPSQSLGVKSFDTPSVVIEHSGVRRGPLVVFLPGTGGSAATAPVLFLHAVASYGHDVIFLQYDDQPSVAALCAGLRPDCSRRVRHSRVFGGSYGLLNTPSGESIINRLKDVLYQMREIHKGEEWSDYITSEGQPNWKDIVVTGLSQGAGMAAYLAKVVSVNRVVLFSGPWDASGSHDEPADWLEVRPATPHDRWWAERHVDERMTQQLAAAYQTLGVPANHIAILNGLPENGEAHGRDIAHLSTVRYSKFTDSWRWLFEAQARP